MRNRYRLLGIIIIALLAGLFAGCGGGSSNASQSGGNTVTLRTVYAASPTTSVNPAWVAFQDGDGAWTRLDPTTTGTYTATLTNAARCYGFAVANDQLSGDTNDDTLSIYHGTTNELSTITDRLDLNDANNTVTISGAVSGVPSGGRWDIETSYNGDGNSGNGSYTLTVPPGTYDLIAALYNNSNDATPSKLLCFRNVHLTGDYSQDINFDSSDAISLTQTYTVSLTNGTVAYGDANLITANGTWIELGGTTGDAPGYSSYQYTALPTGKLASSDLYDIYIDDYDEQSYDRFKDSYYRTAADRSITIPAQIAAPTVTDNLVGTTNFPTMGWESYAHAQLYTLEYSQYNQQSNCSVNTSIALTPGWIAHHGVNSYQLPNFSAMVGWDSTWNLSTSAHINPDIKATVTNESLQNYATSFYSHPYDGLTVSSVYHNLTNRGRATGNLSLRHHSHTMRTTANR